MTKICDFPHPIYDLTKNLIPYSWSDSYIIRVRAFVAGPILHAWQAFNGVEKGKEGERDEEVASSKKKTNWRLECKNRYPIYDQHGG